MLNLKLSALALALFASSVSAQSLIAKQDRFKALGPKQPVEVVVQNYNTYVQTYNITLNGAELDGEITLRPKQKRTIKIIVPAKRNEEVTHRICLKAQPLKTQTFGIALCQNVITF